MTFVEKKSGSFVKVYDIKTDKSGYPKFLIYDNGQWLWKSAKHYRPLTMEGI